MGRTLENKQQIVTEIKSLLNDSEMAVVLDYKGLTIKEMSDLRSRLQTTNGICKVTKNSLMRKAIDKNKPSGAKGKYCKTFYVTSTMGPSVQVDINAVQDYQPEG